MFPLDAVKELFAKAPPGFQAVVRHAVLCRRCMSFLATTAGAIMKSVLPADPADVPFETKSKLIKQHCCEKGSFLIHAVRSNRSQPSSPKPSDEARRAQTLSMMEDHWEFSEYERAFAAFYEQKPQDEGLCLVVSQDKYCSGYWLEHGTQANATTTVYQTIEEVKALERRVRAAIEKSQPAHAVGFVVV